MSTEDEIKAIAASSVSARGYAAHGKTVHETQVDRQLEGIWDALLVLARRLDQA